MDITKAGEKMDKKIAKVIELAETVNNTTSSTVFIFYYGHIERIEIKVYIGGWAEGKKESLSLSCPTSEMSAEEKIGIEIIEKTLRELIK